MKKKRAWYLTTFNVLNLLFAILLPFLLYFLFSAFMSWGFGAVFPLWARFAVALIAFWLFSHRRIKNRLVRLAEGEIQNNQLVSFLKKAAVLFVMLMISVVLWHHYAHQRYLKKLFYAFFPDEYIKNVNLIEGSCFAWQDHFYYLTFKTDKDTFEQITKGYKPLPAQPVAKEFFRGHIAARPNLAGYHRKIIRSSKIHDACYILWDENAGTAYFHAHNGFNSESSPSLAEPIKESLTKLGG
jgi:hypothetical protein